MLQFFLFNDLLYKSWCRIIIRNNENLGVAWSCNSVSWKSVNKISPFARRIGKSMSIFSGLLSPNNYLTHKLIWMNSHDFNRYARVIRKCIPFITIFFGMILSCIEWMILTLSRCHKDFAIDIFIDGSYFEDVENFSVFLKNIRRYCRTMMKIALVLISECLKYIITHRLV